MADRSNQAPDDETVLAAPSEFTVEQVVEALHRAPASRVDQVKAAEKAGKHRRAILDFEPPVLGPVGSTSSPDDDVERYTVAGWRERARLFKVEGRSVGRHALAGALHDASPDELFSQSQVQQRVETFLTTPEDELP